MNAPAKIEVHPLTWWAEQILADEGKPGAFSNSKWTDGQWVNAAEYAVFDGDFDDLAYMIGEDERLDAEQEAQFRRDRRAGLDRLREAV